MVMEPRDCGREPVLVAHELFVPELRANEREVLADVGVPRREASCPFVVEHRVAEVAGLVVRIRKIVIKILAYDAPGNETRVLPDGALVVAPFVERISAGEELGKTRFR